MEPVSAPEPVAQEIIAWRGWNLERDERNEWWLHSVTMQTRWNGPVFVADQVPERHSTYGVYALRDRAHVVRQGYLGNCCGEVALSGVVVEGDNGYRAERATIRRLVLLGYPLPDVRPIEIMAMLEDKYQCEVTWEETTKEQQIQYTINAAALQQQLGYQNTPSFGTQMGSLGYGFGGLGNASGFGSPFGRP